MLGMYMILFYRDKFCKETICTFCDFIYKLFINWVEMEPIHVKTRQCVLCNSNQKLYWESITSFFSDCWEQYYALICSQHQRENVWVDLLIKFYAIHYFCFLIIFFIIISIDNFQHCFDIFNLYHCVCDITIYWCSIEQSMVSSIDRSIYPNIFTQDSQKYLIPVR